MLQEDIELISKYKLTRLLKESRSRHILEKPATIKQLPTTTKINFGTIVKPNKAHGSVLPTEHSPVNSFASTYKKHSNFVIKQTYRY